MHQPPMPTVRAASLNGLGALARRLALDEVALMHQAGLRPRQLVNPDARLNLAAVSLLLDLCARASGRDDFGLLMAAERRASNLGTTGLMTVLQPDLRQALALVIERRREQCSGLMMRLEEADGIAVLTFELQAPGAPPMRQATEQAAGVLAQLARRFLGADWTPRRVCFRHPPPGDMRTHRRMLGWAVEFEHDFNALVFTSQELSTPAPLDDPALAELARRHLPAPLAASRLSEACRDQLSHLLPQGQASIDQVALHLGLQPRTLQRRLQDEGLTFSEVLQDLRQQMATEYLASPHLNLAAIASLLGFASLSAFSRWHKTTFGTSARARR